jgi:hypothetical protein
MKCKSVILGLSIAHLLASTVLLTGCPGGETFMPSRGLTVAPETIGLPSSEPGESSLRWVQVWNHGTAAVQIGEVRTSGGPFSVSATATPPSAMIPICVTGASIESGGRCQLAVVFAPTTSGRFEGTLTIDSSTAGIEPGVANLSGRGQSYCLHRRTR